MGYRVDNVPAYAKRANDRVAAIAAVRLGKTNAEFLALLAAGDEDAREAFAAVSNKYGLAIGLEEAAR